MMSEVTNENDEKTTTKTRDISSVTALPAAVIQEQPTTVTQEVNNNTTAKDDDEAIAKKNIAIDCCCRSWTFVAQFIKEHVDCRRTASYAFSSDNTQSKVVTQQHDSKDENECKGGRLSAIFAHVGVKSSTIAPRTSVPDCYRPTDRL